mgnify:CR=1 FL=1
MTVSPRLEGPGLIVAGLTGGIASGKSTVAAMLAEAGARIIDADRIARDIVAPGREAFQAVCAHFGEAVLQPDGHLDRARLGDMVFHDPRARKDLERIVHPFVFQQMATDLKQLAATQPGAVVILDIPLLIESGRHTALPFIVLVHIPEVLQLSRLIRRDGLAAADARARIRAQMPIEAKRAYADAIIDNSGSREATRRQVRALYRQLHTIEPVSQLGPER